MKSKLKKVLISIQLFFMGIASKVFAASDPKLLDFKGHEVQTFYGIDTPVTKGLRLGKLIIPVLLFVIGLFVILSKKITKKIKTLVISILILLAIYGYLFMNYIIAINR